MLSEIIVSRLNQADLRGKSMSIAGFQRSGIVALALATAMLAGHEAQGAYYFQTADPVETSNSTSANGRGVHITANEDFTVSSIDVWARIVGDAETQFKIFEHTEGADSTNTLPGTEEAQNTVTHSTSGEWDWISFPFSYTFEAGSSYVLYWYGLGESLPSEAMEEKADVDYDLLTIDYGVAQTGSATPGEPNATNFYVPVFRLAIPEPATAPLVLLGGVLTLTRRRR